MKHLSDEMICDQIRDTRRMLATILPAGDCLGRRMATALLARLEDEMVRRYEVELWGCERG